MSTTDESASRPVSAPVSCRNQPVSPEEAASRRSQHERVKQMVGLTVRFSENAQRVSPGVPTTPMLITTVARRSNRIIVKLEGRDARGKPLKYSDGFHYSENVHARYENAVAIEATPLNPEAYAGFLNFSSRAGKRAHEEVFSMDSEPLANVMPFFQLQRSVRMRKGNLRRLRGDDLSDLQCLLATDCEPFHQTEDAETNGIWRAITTKGQRFDTSTDTVRQEAYAMLHAHYTREDIAHYRCVLPEELRVAAGTPLHGWQAWMFSFFKHQMRDGQAAVKVLLKRDRGDMGVVQGLASLPQRLSICVAEPGEGKSRVGVLCAFGRPTMVIAVRATVRHWLCEAAKMGVKAFQIGSGGKKAKEGLAAIQADPNQMFILTREVLRLVAKGGKWKTLPEPSLVIIDEFHSPLPCFKDLFNAYPLVDALGLSGTFGPSRVVEVAEEIGWDADLLEAAVVRIPRGNRNGSYPKAEVHVHLVHMTELERSAYEAAVHAGMDEAERMQVLVFPPPEVEDDYAETTFAAALWVSITKMLHKAENTVHKRLARLLKHIFHEDTKKAVLEELLDNMSPQAVQRIEEYAADLPSVTTSYGASEIRSQLHSALDHRKKIVGSHGFLVRELDAAAAESEIECPVCYDQKRLWSIAKCGHIVCDECKGYEQVQSTCPKCREANPCWKSAADLARMRCPGFAAPASSSRFDTSAKLRALMTILAEVPESDKALVICPKSILRAVATEMRRMGVLLGLMMGGGAEQERTLKAWRTGKENYKGLLCPPEILGVDLPEASTIIFLTDLMTMEEFEQALARVVRQGNCCVAKGVAVQVWLLICKDTEEQWQQNLSPKISLAESSGANQEHLPTEL